MQLFKFDNEKFKKYKFNASGIGLVACLPIFVSSYATVPIFLFLIPLVVSFYVYRPLFLAPDHHNNKEVKFSVLLEPKKITVSNEFNGYKFSRDRAQIKRVSKRAIMGLQIIRLDFLNNESIDLVNLESSDALYEYLQHGHQ